MPSQAPEEQLCAHYVELLARPPTAAIAALKPLRIRFLLPQLAIFELVLGSLQIRWIPRLSLSESVRCRWACLAPHVQFAAAPGHGTHTEANRAGELLLGHEPVDRGSTQARHLHDGWHAQKHGWHLIVKIWWWAGWLLHGVLPVEACRYFRVRFGATSRWIR